MFLTSFEKFPQQEKRLNKRVIVFCGKIKYHKAVNSAVKK